MNTTTKTDWKVTVVAWGIALVACAALAWGILSAPPSSTQGTMKLPEGHAVEKHHGALKPRAARPAKLNEKMKMEQAHRALPSQYAKELVEQSEISV